MFKTPAGRTLRSALLDIIPIARYGNYTAQRCETRSHYPVFKACQSHATVERAPEAPWLLKVGVGIGVFKTPAGRTLRSALLDIAPIAQYDNYTAQRCETRSHCPV